MLILCKNFSNILLPMYVNLHKYQTTGKLVSADNALVIVHQDASGTLY